MDITIPMTFAGLLAELEKPQYKEACEAAKIRIWDYYADCVPSQHPEVVTWLGWGDASRTADLWYELECGKELIKDLERLQQKMSGDRRLIKLLKEWQEKAAEIRQKFRTRQFDTAGEKFAAIAEVTPLGAKEFQEAYLRVGGTLDDLPDVAGAYGDRIAPLWDVLWSRKDHANEMTFAIYLALAYPRNR